MKNMKLAGLAALLLLTTSCTENARVKAFGGSGTMDLPPGRKLVNITFKESNLWVLTRAAKPGEIPEVYEFTEKSNLGVLEGKIVIREK